MGTKTRGAFLKGNTKFAWCKPDRELQQRAHVLLLVGAKWKSRPAGLQGVLKLCDPETFDK